MPNWDDEFDLDDYNPKKPPPKPKQTKKNNNQDDFFDLDDPAPTNTKLPALPKQNKPSPSTKTNNNYEDYEEINEELEEPKSPPKKQEKSKKQQNYDDEEVPKPAISRLPSINKLSSAKKEQPFKEPPKPVKQEEDEEQFYESLDDNKPKTVPKSQPQTVKKEEPQEQEEPYEQQFDEYGEDFEEVDEKPLKQLPKKSQTTANLKPKEKAIKEPQKLKTEEKKLVINTNKVFTNKQQKEKEKPVVPPKPPMKENSKQPSKKVIEPPKKPIQSYHGAAVSQQKPMQRSASKRSLQSNDSRKHLGNSKVSTRRKTTEATASRHMDLVEKQFPDSEERVGEYPPERLSRLNQQVREMIRKFNEELNELINRNMILLKDKPTERTHNAQEKQRILEEQLKSGATALQVVENQLDRLRGREGELREEEYQLIMEKRIEDTKESIKQMSKLVTRMKAQVNSDGNKLSKHEAERKLAQDLHQIKLMLIQTKKQEEKNEVTLKKVEKMCQDLESKNSDKEYELSQQIDNARDKGVTLNVKQSTRKRYQELKLKSTALQNHKRVTESLARTKCEHLSHQTDQMRTTIRSIDSQIANIHKSIEFSQQQSIKLIKKAKENSRLSTALSETLDKILKSIQDNQTLNYYEIRTEGNNSQASQRPLKNSMYENMGSGSKEKPVMRGSSSKKQPGSAARQKAPTPPPVPPPSSDEINLMKPNFMKKKEKQETSPSDEKEKSNKLYQRVWNEQQERRKQQEQRRKQQQERKRVEQQQRKQQQAQKLAAAEEQKKKPFNLKKNRMNNEQKEKTVEASPEVNKISEAIEMKVAPAQQSKEEEKPSIGPKFMRLRNKNGQGNKNDVSTDKPIEEIKKPIIEEPKVEPKSQEQQPVFVPKRFNLRNKIQKKDEGYVPTADKSMQAKKEEPKKVQPVKEQAKKEYAPNFSFKEQEPFKAAIPEPKKVEEEIKIEEKPRFNLRLRDRQKKQGDDSYMPTRLTEVDTKPVAKPETGVYNPFDREPLKKEEPKAYQPSFKPVQEKPLKPSLDFAPTKQPVLPPKEPVNNPYAAKEEPVVNPYAPKEEPPKRQREGPLKKNKLANKGPKEKFNIYEQAEDITEAAPHVPLNDPKPQIPVNDPPRQANLAKTDELDLNAMLGIKKKEKVNDLDDLLGEVSVGKKKERKKNNDFFNDLEL